MVLLANSGLQIFKLGLLINGASILTSAFFTAAGNGKVSALISFLNSFTLPVTFIVFLPKVFGVSGIWLAVPLAELGTSLVAIALLSRNRHRYWGGDSGRKAAFADG